MPIRTTFNDLVNAADPNLFGFPTCDPRFLKLCNRAQRSLGDAGRWYGTICKMRFCQYAGCITFPRGVATIERMFVCRTPVYVRNQWWEFQVDYPVPPAGNRRLEHGWSFELVPRGNVVLFQDLAYPAYIQLYPQSAADVGLSVRLEGYNASGGALVNENVVLALPYAQSVYQYQPQQLTGVQKPITTGNINVTAFYDAQQSYAAVGYWEPSETNPSYIRKYLVNAPQCFCNTPTGGWNGRCRDYGDGCAPALLNCPSQVAADFLVRREFIPITPMANGQGVGTDWMFIDNIEAVLDEMQALQAKGQNQTSVYQEHHQLALTLLRNELDKYDPPEQITCNVQPWGSAQPTRVTWGMRG